MVHASCCVDACGQKVAVSASIRYRSASLRCALLSLMVHLFMRACARKCTLRQAGRSAAVGGATANCQQTCSPLVLRLGASGCSAAWMLQTSAHFLASAQQGPPVTSNDIKNDMRTVHINNGRGHGSSRSPGAQRGTQEGLRMARANGPLSARRGDSPCQLVCRPQRCRACFPCPSPCTCPSFPGNRPLRGAATARDGHKPHPQTGGDQRLLLPAEQALQHGRGVSHMEHQGAPCGLFSPVPMAQPTCMSGMSCTCSSPLSTSRQAPGGGGDAQAGGLMPCCP